MFSEEVWNYYNANGRHDLPWRLASPDGSFDAYKIVVSEMMLQQTQVSRVIPKFLSFIAEFPSVFALATASQGDVLRAWSGLGYNRRARFLHQSAKVVVAQYNGMQDKHNLTLPTIPDALYKFDFVSPAWSMDLAGWSIVATVVSFALFVILLIADFWFKKNIV